MKIRLHPPYILIALAIIGFIGFTALKLTGKETQEVEPSIDVFADYSWDDSFPSQRDAFFQFITDAIRDGYSYLDHKQQLLGFDWQEVSDYYREKISSIDNEPLFLYYCTEMFGILDDGHTYITPNVAGYSFPISLVSEGDDYIIANFSSELAEQVPWLDPGQKLITLDGHSIDDIIQQILANSGYHLVNAGKELIVPDLFAKYYFYFLLDKRPATSILDIQLSDGRVQELELNWEQTVLTPGAITRRFAKRERVGLGVSLLANQIGYIKIDALDANLFSLKELDNAFAKVWEADSLILDLRENGGGDFTTYGRHLLSYFLKEPVNVTSKVFRNSPYLHVYGKDKLHYPGNPAYDEEWYDPVRIPAEPRNSVWSKPVVILVNEHLFSSADTLLAALADLEVGALIGRLSPLHSGQPLAIPTPWSRWSASISSIISLSASGAVTEDRIITPDVYVPVTREEILKTADPILEAATNYLTNMEMETQENN